MKAFALLLALSLPAAAAELPWQSARQMVVVTMPGWDSTIAAVSRWDRIDGQWQPAGEPWPATIGRAGAAWGLGLHPPQPGTQKAEGDGRAPAGVFRIGPAFGYAPTLQTAMPYLPMTPTHWCMDVPASPHYNRIVDARDVGEAAVAGSTERMRLDLVTPGDDRYRTGLVIQHNPANVPGAGSCIFAHLWQRPGTPTAGCTAMEDAAMQELTGWLDPAREPVLVLLPREQYEQLRTDWDLPALERANPHH